MKDINAAIPTAKIFGGDGVCTSAVTNPAKGGFPKSIAPLFFCTQPALDLSAYPGGTDVPGRVQGEVRRRQPRAVLDLRLRGDEARARRRSLALASQGNSKSAVLSALFATKNYKGVTGTFGFDANGDTR